MKMKKKFAALVLFGIAFGFVEAAVVSYLRLLLNYNNSYLHNGYTVLLNLGFIAFVNPKSPLLHSLPINSTETVREFATIIMLLSISFLAGKTLKQRIAAFMIAFSTWDIFYYVFLNVITGWPKSLFDIDVYFLIPVTWVGPVITPVIISLLLFITGTILYKK